MYKSINDNHTTPRLEIGAARQCRATENASKDRNVWKLINAQMNPQ